MPNPKDCQHERLTKRGRDRYGRQRWKCKDCGRLTGKEHKRPLGDMRIDPDKACDVLGLLLEGMSVRACGRILNMKPETICNLILTAGESCDRFLATVRGVTAARIEMDEIWSFVNCRAKCAREKEKGYGAGNIWTWLAIDIESKLILSHMVGKRDHDTCAAFMLRLNRATIGNTVVTSDMLCTYGRSIELYLGSRATHNPVQTTTYSERFNLTLRMHVRRFARSTNAHSKSLRHHAAMLSLFVGFYNYCRINAGSAIGEQPTTPAMAAGLTDRRWTIGELLTIAAHSTNTDFDGSYKREAAHAPDSMQEISA